MDCSHIPLISYEKFSLRLHGDLGGRRIPIDCSFEITNHCNLHCVQCYCVPEQGRKELSLTQVKGLIDDLAEAGCLWLLLTGGEPLVRPDFAEIYTYAKGKGFVTTLFTNGTLITPALADLLLEYRPFSVEISLYGATRETYERVTGIPGSFAACWRGIELLREREIPLRLKSTISSINQHELAKMKDQAQELGLSFRFDCVLNPRMDGSQAPNRVRIPPEKVVAFDVADQQVSKSWREFCAKFWNLSYPEEAFTCLAGTNSCHINAYGGMQLCMMVKRFEYDLLSGSFRQGWGEFIPKLRAMKSLKPSRCNGCEVIPICDRCAAWSLLEHGDLESPVAYLCEIAKLRARAFGMVQDNP